MIDLRLLKILVVVVYWYAMDRRLPFIFDNLRRALTYPLREWPPRDPYSWRLFEEQDETLKEKDMGLLERFVVLAVILIYLFLPDCIWVS